MFIWQPMTVPPRLLMVQSHPDFFYPNRLYLTAFRTVNDRYTNLNASLFNFPLGITEKYHLRYEDFQDFTVSQDYGIEPHCPPVAAPHLIGIEPKPHQLHLAYPNGQFQVMPSTILERRATT